MLITTNNDRRKVRSQTSDNMDRWKSRGGKSQRREEKKREDQRRERVRRMKTMQVREKVEKSRLTVFFQWFVAPEGRKVGSLKRRVRSHLARWEMKNCTPLWREAHSEVKTRKTLQNTPTSEHFWKLRCRKSARHCGAKHISKPNALKTDGLGPLLEVEMMLKKRTPLWRGAHFQVKVGKTHHQSVGLRTTKRDLMGPPLHDSCFGDIKLLEDSWFTCSILVICDYLLCGRCGSARDCSKGDRGWTGLDGLQLHSSRIALCGCTGLVFCLPPALPPWFWGE